MYGIMTLILAPLTYHRARDMIETIDETVEATETETEEVEVEAEVEVEVIASVAVQDRLITVLAVTLAK